MRCKAGWDLQFPAGKVQKTRNDCRAVPMNVESRSRPNCRMKRPVPRVDHCPWNSYNQTTGCYESGTGLFYAAQTPLSSDATLTAFLSGEVYPDRGNP